MIVARIFLFSTCGDAVEGLRHQIVDLLVQLRGRAFAVNLIHCGVGAEYPLHQPLQFTVTGELVPSQVSEEKKNQTSNSNALSFLNGFEVCDCCLCSLALTTSLCGLINIKRRLQRRTGHLQQVIDCKLSLFLTAACNFNGAKSTTHTFFKPLAEEE